MTSAVQNKNMRVRITEQALMPQARSLRMLGTLLLGTLILAGCMKPVDYDRTVVDPSSEEAGQAPQVSYPNWRENREAPEAFADEADVPFAEPMQVPLPQPVKPVVSEKTGQSSAGVNAGGSTVAAETASSGSGSSGQSGGKTAPSPDATSPNAANPSPESTTAKTPPVDKTVSEKTSAAGAETTSAAGAEATSAAGTETTSEAVTKKTSEAVTEKAGGTGNQKVSEKTDKKDPQSVATWKLPETAPIPQPAQRPRKRFVPQMRDEKPAGTAPAAAAIPRPASPPAKKVESPSPQSGTPQSQGDTSYSVAKPTNKDIVENGIITPTIYFLAVLNEDKESCADKVGLYLTSGKVRMQVCRRTMSFCSEQGSCLIKKDGKWSTFNVIRRVHGVDQFQEITDSCVYGYGVRNICLDPFYTVAADLKIYKPGDVIFLPKLRGEVLPNGQRHDGYLIVRDQGRGVIGKGRFDFFSGGMSWTKTTNPFVRLKLGSTDTDLEYHRVVGEMADQVRAKRGYPILPKRGIVPVQMTEANTAGTPTSTL